jgi:hypothetical protein
VRKNMEIAAACDRLQGEVDAMQGQLGGDGGDQAAAAAAPQAAAHGNGSAANGVDAMQTDGS